MLKRTDPQRSFYDADQVCEQLIPPDSFYRQFREVVAPLIQDEQFAAMYCPDNGRPPIPPSLLACATILQEWGTEWGTNGGPGRFFGVMRDVVDGVE